MSDRQAERAEPFPPTRWTQVSLAAAADPETRRQALTALLENYYQALRSHLTVVRHVPAAEAADLLHEFVASQVHVHDIFARADPARGRFRTFVLTALDHYVNSRRRAERAERRGGGRTVSIEAAAVEVPAPVSSSDVFDLAWARQVLVEATRRMREQCQATGRDDVWGVFEHRLMRPILESTEPLPYDQLIRRFGLHSPRAARNLLLTARRLCRRCLESVVAEYAVGRDGVRSEVQELCAIFNEAGGADGLEPAAVGTDGATDPPSTDPEPCRA